MNVHPQSFVSLPNCLSHLATEPRWVGWKWESRIDKQGNAKRTKPPRQAGGAYAHNDKPETWARLDMIDMARHGFDGIGLQLLNLKGFAALDLDKVRDADTGAVLPWAAAVIACGSYAEVTPSGTGFRVLGTVAPDHPAMHRKFNHPQGGEIEFYAAMETGRYITVTGERFGDAPDALAPLDALIVSLWNDVQPKPKALDFTTGNVAGFRDLPDDLQDAIASGSTGDRSADFQGVVNALYARTDYATALRILGAHPQGPAGKYAGRLEKELRRSWDKAAASQSGIAGSVNSAPVNAEPWGVPDPKYLTDVLPEPPALPLDDVFSPQWARWIRAAADSKGAAADYVVAGLLAVTGSLIGNTRWSAPWSGWSEPPIIWSIAIGTPSSNKSPGLDAVIVPLRKVEREARQAAKAEHDEWKARAEVAKLFESTWKEAVKKAIANGDTPPAKPAEASPGREPFLPRYAISDATVEKVADIVAGQPRGTLQVRDEISGWLGNMSRYNSGSDRPFWLEAYGGRSFSVERMGREPQPVDRLSVGVLGGIQPDRLKSLLFKSDDDGLLARFVPVWPHPTPIKRPDAAADPAFIESALRRLLALRMVVDGEGEERPWFIPFAERTRDMLDAFRVQCREWESGEEGLLLSFIGKLPGLSVRLSLVLAYLDYAAGALDPTEIEPEHFGRAADLIESYVLPMARRAYADGSLPKEVKAGKRLAALILEQGWQTFTTSQVLLLDRPGLLTKAEVDPALEALELGSLIRPDHAPTGPRGGRPSRRFIVNPKIGG